MALNWWFHPPDNLLPSSSPMLSDVEDDEMKKEKKQKGKRGRGQRRQAGSTSQKKRDGKVEGGSGSGSGSGSGTATPSGLNGDEASSGAAVAAAAKSSNGGGFAQPYRDVEVWDHLRQEVQRLVAEAIELGDVDRRPATKKVDNGAAEDSRSGRKKGKKRARGD